MAEDREDDGLVVIAAFTNVHEATLAQSILDGAGVDSVLNDEHIVSMEWTLSNAVGGVKVLVAVDRVEEAWQVLANEGLVNREDLDQMLEGVPALPGDVCSACGGDEFDSVLPARGLVVLTWFVLGFPVGIPRRRRHCRRCGALE